MKNWYLTQLKTNSHRLAQRNLNQQGFKTFLPLYEVTQRKGSKFVTDIVPLFPGYMFVRFDSNLTNWQKINSTIGVSRLVSFDNKPSSLPNEFMSALLFRCDGDGKLIISKTFSEGDSVEILTGPFAKFVATVESIDSQNEFGLYWSLWDKNQRLTLQHRP